MRNRIHKFNVFDKNFVLDINSGSILEVDELVYELLDYYSTEGIDEIDRRLLKYSSKDVEEGLEEIEALVRQGVLYSIADYDSAISLLDQRQRVKALCLNVAHDCNLRCTYCFASKGDYKGKREIMTKNVGKRSVDFLVESSEDLRHLEIDFFGGEPLLAMDTVREVVSYARSIESKTKKTFHFTMTTNAVLLTDENINYLHENMDNIVLSLDGRKAIHDAIRIKCDGSGSYDQVVENIKKIVELRKKDSKEYYVRGTFTKDNLDFSNDVFHLADLGFTEISIEPVVGDDGDYLLEEKDLAIINTQYEKIAWEYLHRKASKKNPFTFYHFKMNIYDGPCILKRLLACGAGREYLAITPSGEIYPCHQFVGRDEFVMGDVFKKVLDENIIEKMKNTNVLRKEKCTECWARFYCSGGCNANNYLLEGDMNAPYSLTCEMQKSRIEKAIYLAALAGDH